MSSKAIPVLGFVAPSGTGKTTLLRKLVPVLRKRGLRVGYLKHAHHTFDLDVPGKDSYEIREAGADQTLLASSERWALQVENRVRGADPDLVEMLAQFRTGSLDLVLVEGFKHSAYPKIRDLSLGPRKGAALSGGQGHHRGRHRQPAPGRRPSPGAADRGP